MAERLDFIVIPFIGFGCSASSENGLDEDEDYSGPAPAPTGKQIENVASLATFPRRRETFSVEDLENAHVMC